MSKSGVYMNKFVYFFVLVTTVIDFALLWCMHFRGADMAFQAAAANYMLTLIIFIEIGTRG